MAGDDVPLLVHLKALRKADRRFAAERDRRYAEVNIEREKALKIKEEADKVALDLARQIQTYKDEKANDLREQITGERGLYASKNDVIAAIEKVQLEMGPLDDYVRTARGQSQGVSLFAKVGFLTIGVIGTLIGIVGVAASLSR